MIEEVAVRCPACWETIELTVDLSAGSAAYTEDCSVCCRPMLVRLEVTTEGHWRIDVEAESD